MSYSAFSLFSVFLLIEVEGPLSYLSLFHHKIAYAISPAVPHRLRWSFSADEPTPFFPSDSERQTPPSPATKLLLHSHVFSFPLCFFFHPPSGSIKPKDSTPVFFLPFSLRAPLLPFPIRRSLDLGIINVSIPSPPKPLEILTPFLPLLDFFRDS